MHISPRDQLQTRIPSSYPQAWRNRSGQSGHDPTKILADQDFERGQKRALATLAVPDYYERILALPVLRVGSLNLHDDDHESHARYAAESPPVRDEESRVHLMAAGLRVFSKRLFRVFLAGPII